MINGRSPNGKGDRPLWFHVKQGEKMPAWAMWSINGFFCLCMIAAIFWPLPKSVRRYENVTRKPPEKP